MKANKNQIDAAQTLKICLDCMVDTNDITSPTIYNEIEILVRLEMEEYADEDLHDVMGSRFFGKTLCWLIDPFNEFGNVILNKKDVLTSNIMYHKKGITLNLTYKF